MILFLYSLLKLFSGGLKMKKLIAFVSAALLAAGLIGCASTQTEELCEKEAFRNQFNQEIWDELPEQFRAGDTPNILCNRYDGWIDSKVDTLDDKIR